MTDKELLEYAALSVGFFVAEFGEHSKVCWCVPLINKKMITEWCPINSGRNKFEGTDCFRWNPLNDDGDAFRLAVKLGVDLYVDENKTEVWVTELNHPIEYVSNDPYEATRRAIVRAAAEIGKTLNKLSRNESTN